MQRLSKFLDCCNTRLAWSDAMCKSRIEKDRSENMFFVAIDTVFKVAGNFRSLTLRTPQRSSFDLDKTGVAH